MHCQWSMADNAQSSNSDQSSAEMFKLRISESELPTLNLRFEPLQTYTSDSNVYGLKLQTRTAGSGPWTSVSKLHSSYFPKLYSIQNRNSDVQFADCSHRWWPASTQHVRCHEDLNSRLWSNFIRLATDDAHNLSMISYHRWTLLTMHTDI